MLLVISLLVAPGLGLFAADFGTDKLLSGDQFKSIEAAMEYCGSATHAGEGCQILASLQMLHRVSLIALIVSLALPLTYLVIALVLARSRSLLAHGFPWLVRLVLAVLPVLLTAHGLLVWFGSWEMLQMGIIPGNVKLLLVLGGLGLTLLIAALSIVTSIRRMLEIEPLHVTGVQLEPQEMPALFARVLRIAAKLGSREPQRIILGIEPTAYVANVAVKLRGVGDLPVEETLYLPTSALRVLDEAELDALIGHELGHFRGADVDFSTRYAPAYRSLAIAAEAVQDESDAEEGGNSIALFPAIGLLSFMLYTITHIVNRIGRQREFAADRAALEVSTPRAVVSLLVKFSALAFHWQGFRNGFTHLLHQGVTRQNLSRDYLVRTRQFISAFSGEELRKGLIEAHTPHPLDTHPSLSQRAEAVGVDPAGIFSSGLAAILVDRPEPPGLAAIEERISQIDAEYYRHPAQRVMVSNDPELPNELKFTRAQKAG